jgi:hypothetical protein
MLRGTRPFLLAVVFAMALGCASANAATIPDVHALTVPTGGSPLAAFDGSDLYWTYPKYVSFENGFGVDTYVNRTSFLDGTTVPIFHTSAAKGEDLDYIDAGGGVVALGIEIDGTLPDDTEAPLETQVIRFNRDGTGKQIVAAGKEAAIDNWAVVSQNGKAKLNDCGTWVELSAVSTAGEVFYAHDDQQRESKACGGRPNTNNWTYNGVALDGTTRTILTVAAPVHTNIKALKNGGFQGGCDCGAAGHRDVSVIGNWALVKSYSNAAVLNLVTGAMSAPYPLASIPHFDDRAYSIDSSGRVIAHGDYVHKGGHRRKRTIRTRIFPVPGDPSTSVPVAGNPRAISCGDNFYSTTLSKSKVLTVNLLDPSTGAIARVVGQINDNAGLQLWGCGGGFMYIGRNKRSRTEIRAIPLG